jgi:hypothetical protein
LGSFHGGGGGATRLGTRALADTTPPKPGAGPGGLGKGTVATARFVLGRFTVGGVGPEPESETAGSTAWPSPVAAKGGSEPDMDANTVTDLWRVLR